MSTNISALQAAIKLLADGVGAIETKNYGTIMGDLINLLPQLGDIPSEVSGLAVADYETLAANLVTDLALPSGSVSNIVNASLKVLTDIVSLEPDVVALVAAIKS